MTYTKIAKNVTKVVLSVFVITQVLLPVAAIADGPAFAVINKVSNSTTEMVWKKSIVAYPGNTVAFYIYFNNIGNADATNTIVKDTLPAELTYKPGSTRYWNGTTLTPLPDGITSTGINIGTVKPGNENSGYVVFKTTVKNITTPGTFTLTNTASVKADGVNWVSDTTTITLIIEGTAQLATINKVLNFSNGETVWVKSTNAKPGDQIHFYIYFNNIGNVDANNLIVRDILPNGMTYINGSTALWNGQSFQPLPDGITGNGINLGTLQPGNENSRYVVFKAKVNESGWSNGTFTLTNRGRVSADNATMVEDTSTVIVTKSGVPALANIHKVLNYTAGETVWKKETTANPNDIIHFYIYFNNIGDAPATNVIVKDTLPAQLTYINGSTALWNGQSFQPLPDGITGNGINLGTLQPGNENSRYVVFKARVNNNLNPGIYSTISTAKVSADGVNEVPDTSKVVIIVEEPGCPNLTIINKVLNYSAGETEWKKSTDAEKGDIIHFYIYYNNIGDEAATNVIIRDTLPAQLTYINGSTALWNGQSFQPLPDGITGNGINLGTLQPGNENSRYVVFKARVRTDLTPGLYQVTNTARIFAANAPDEKTDSTTINISVIPYQTTLKTTTKIANVTKGENWKKSTSGQPGDLISFYVYYNNVGNLTALDVTIIDSLPKYLTYVKGSTRWYTNQTGSIGQPLPDGITSASGLKIGNVEPGVGNSGYVVFQARVKTGLKPGTYNLTNRVTVFADNADSVSDTAKLTIKVSKAKKGYIYLTTKVANISTGEKDWKIQTSAKPGDTVEFLISFKNTGTATIKNLTIRNILPAGMKYVPNTTKLYLNNQVKMLPNKIGTSKGINIGNIKVNQKGYITFRAIVKADAKGELKNKVVATASGGLKAQSINWISIVVPGGSASGQLPHTGPNVVTVIAIATLIALLTSLFIIFSTEISAGLNKIAQIFRLKK